MPYLSIETNQTVEASAVRKLMLEASAFVAGLLGKPESYVMISIKPEMPLSFGGTTDPAAFVRLKSIGLPADRCAQLAEQMCTFLDRKLQVPGDRVFIEFKDVERNLFGWNGTTF
jgi:hypothetical protein